MRKDAGEGVHALAQVRYYKNRIKTLLNDSETAAECQIAFLRWFFLRLNQLNISIQGKGKMFLDVSKTSSRLKVQNAVVNLLNRKWKNSCFSDIKCICRRGRNWFALHSSNRSWAPYCIFPSWIDIRHIPCYNYIKTLSLFWGALSTGSLWSGLQCWTAGWAAKSTIV